MVEQLGRISDLETQYRPLPAGAQEKSILQKWKFKLFRLEVLIWWTLSGVAAGIALGVALYHANCSPQTIELIGMDLTLERKQGVIAGYPGELLIRALQELVLPLVVFALMTGVFNLRHSSSGTSRIVRWSLMYYLLSMLLAVGVGIALVEIIKPGRHTSFEASSADSCSNSTSTATSHAEKSVVESLLNVGRNFVPTNIVQAASEPNFLGVILFSVVFAYTVNSMGDPGLPLIHLIEFCNEVILKMIRALITFTPAGVASLIASTILKACNLESLLQALGLYVATVIGGFLIHSFIILPITMLLLSRQNPLRAAKAFLPALVMGVGTSSSAATMPLTMQCAEAFKCNPSIVQFVIPLGTNINRDGAALYEAVSVIFILQAHGVRMTAGNLLVVVITATLAAIGSASIPNSALVTMITVLQALGYAEYISDVAVLYAVDWLLGMLRTSVNIWGDACACVIVNYWERQFAKKYEAETLASSLVLSPIPNQA